MIVSCFGGVYLALRGVHITNNSNINIRNIGQSSDSLSGALQCISGVELNIARISQKTSPTVFIEDFLFFYITIALYSILHALNNLIIYVC